MYISALKRTFLRPWPIFDDYMYYFKVVKIWKAFKAGLFIQYGKKYNQNVITPGRLRENFGKTRFLFMEYVLV